MYSPLGDTTHIQTIALYIYLFAVCGVMYMLVCGVCVFTLCVGYVCGVHAHVWDMCVHTVCGVRARVWGMCVHTVCGVHARVSTLCTSTLNLHVKA